MWCVLLLIYTVNIFLPMFDPFDGSLPSTVKDTQSFTSELFWQQVEAEVGVTAPLSVRVADPWCWGAREGRRVRSSGRPAAASVAAGAAVCPGAAAEATEVGSVRFLSHHKRMNKGSSSYTGQPSLYGSEKRLNP